MRTALLLSGHARFCAEFDMQIDNLVNSEVDWYVVLWNLKRTDKFQRSNYLSPSWTATTVEEARDFIEARLPTGHRLAHVELLDPGQYPKVDPNRYKNIDCTPENFFAEYGILKLCDQRRIDSGIDYDLVVRSRPDIGISPMLDLKQIKQYLLKQPNVIITPKNRRSCGINTIFAIGLPDTIKTYCELVDHVDHFNLNLNVKFHTELMIGTILGSQGLVWPDTNVEIFLRTQGTGSDRSEDGDTWVPNFGRWI
jgi:hypothetical protein